MPATQRAVCPGRYEANWSDKFYRRLVVALNEEVVRCWSIGRPSGAPLRAVLSGARSAACQGDGGRRLAAATGRGDGGRWVARPPARWTVPLG